MTLQLALSLVAFDPRPTVRRSDPTSSVVCAIDRAESGRAALEAAAVLRCLARHNGSTSAELAKATEDVGRSEFGQAPEAWRHTVARRLPGLEDRGEVEAVAPSFKLGRGVRRRVDPNMEPCRVSVTATGNRVKSLRWYVGGAR